MAWQIHFAVPYRGGRTAQADLVDRDREARADQSHDPLIRFVVRVAAYRPEAHGMELTHDTPPLVQRRLFDNEAAVVADGILLKAARILVLQRGENLQRWSSEHLDIELVKFQDGVARAFQSVKECLTCLELCLVAVTFHSIFTYCRISFLFPRVGSCMTVCGHTRDGEIVDGNACHSLRRTEATWHRAMSEGCRAKEIRRVRDAIC